MVCLYVGIVRISTCVGLNQWESKHEGQSMTSLRLLDPGASDNGQSPARNAEKNTCTMTEL